MLILDGCRNQLPQDRHLARTFRKNTLPVSGFCYRVSARVEFPNLYIKFANIRTTHTLCAYSCGESTLECA